MGRTAGAPEEGEAGELWIPFAPRAGVRDGAPQPLEQAPCGGLLRQRGHREGSGLRSL